jgi:hypothetical protein
MSARCHTKEQIMRAESIASLAWRPRIGSMNLAGGWPLPRAPAATWFLPASLRYDHGESTSAPD